MGRVKKNIVLLAAVLVSASVGFGVGKFTMHGRLEEAFSRQKPIQDSTFFLCPPVAVPQKQDFEKRYDEYTEEEKAAILKHVKKALSGVGFHAPELEKAAAINDYIYQYLIHRDNTGSAPKLLQDGYAICGGAVVCMTEMLYAIGIKSKFAYLLGIPDQGAHSLVEVFFGDGNQGLFDPTFGILWYDPERGLPLSMMELLEKPLLVKSTLFKSRNEKRQTASDPVKISEDFASSYSLRLNH